MFDSLSDRLSGVFDRLRGRGALNEADVTAIATVHAHTLAVMAPARSARRTPRIRDPSAADSTPGWTPVIVFACKGLCRNNG